MYLIIWNPYNQIRLQTKRIKCGVKKQLESTGWWVKLETFCPLAGIFCPCNDRHAECQEVPQVPRVPSQPSRPSGNVTNNLGVYTYVLCIVYCVYITNPLPRWGPKPGVVSAVFYFKNYGKDASVLHGFTVLCVTQRILRNFWKERWHVVFIIKSPMLNN